MRKLYQILFLFVLVHSSCVVNAKNNTAGTNLALPAATISGTTSVCQNAASPQITFTGSGGTAPYTFTYKLNGGATQTVSSNGTNDSVTIPVTTSASGTFTYDLVSVHDANLPLSEITQTGAAIITINPQPDASLSGTGSGTTFNGIPAFRICSNVTSSFTFSNASSTASTLNTNYTIDWGDGSANFTSASWSTTTHTYAVGYWNLTYTIQNTNSCEIIKKYACPFCYL